MASIGTFTATFLASVAGFINPVKEATASLGGLQKGLKSTQQELNNIGKKAEIIGAPIQALGVLALGAAADIKKGMTEIRVATGATGARLEALRGDFNEVFGDTAQSSKEVGEAISVLNVRLGLTGQPLQQLTKQFLDLAQVTESEVKPLVEDTTKVFAAFKVPIDQQSKALEFLFNTYRNTGVGVQKLEGELLSSGASLRNLGFSFEQSAVLVAKFDKEGVDASGIVRSLNRAFVSLAKQGIEPGQQALDAIIERIKTAPTPIKAAQDAIAVFGQRAGPIMAEAIRAGRFEIGELTRQIAASKDTIKATDDETKTFSEHMGEIRHVVEVALEPFGRSIRGTFTNIVIPLLKEGAATVKQLADAFASLPKSAQTSIIGVAAAIALLGPGLILLGKLAFTINEVVKAAKLLSGLKFFSALGDAASLFQGAKSFGDIATALKIIGSSAAGLTAVSVAVGAIGAAIGLAAGLTFNWILRVTGLESAFDKLFLAVIRNVPLVGNALANFVTRTDDVKKNAAGAAVANEALAKRAEALGIAVDRTRLSSEEYVNSIRQQVRAQDQATPAIAATESAVTKLGKSLGLSGQALIDFEHLFDPKGADKYKQALESVREKVSGDTTEMRALNQVIQEFTAAGVPAIVVIERLGKLAQESATNWQNLGKAVPEATRALALSSIFFENFKKLSDELTVNQLELKKVLVDGGAAFIKVLTDQSKALQKQIDDIVNYNVVLQRLREQRDQGIGTGAPILQAPVPVPTPTFGISRVDEKVAVEGIDAARKLGEEAQITAAKIDKMKTAGMNLDQITLVLGGDIEKAAETVRVFGDKVDDGAKELIKFANAQIVGKNFIDDIVNDISKIFTDSIAHGKSFWEAFKDLGKDALASVADFFVKNIIHAMLDPLKAAIGELIQGLKNTLSNVLKNININVGGLPIGGTAIGAGIAGGLAATRGTGGAGTVLAGIGGTTAGVIGGTVLAAGAAGAAGGIGFGAGVATLVAATGPLIPIAAAAAAALIIFGHAIGNAHKQANEFVQKFQNPFGDAFLQIVDSNNKLYAAGRQTYEGAVAAQEQVTTLWATFTKQANEFAKQGGDQAKVVKQALAVLNPQVDSFFKNIGDEIDKLMPRSTKLFQSVFNVEHFDEAKAALQGEIDAARERLLQIPKDIKTALSQRNYLKFQDLAREQDALNASIKALTEQLNTATVPAVYSFNEAIAATADAVDTNTVQSFINKVFESVNGVGSLNEAIRVLLEAGTPAAVITKQLGSDINSFADALDAMGLPIPDLIKQFRGLTTAATEAAGAVPKPTASLEFIKRVADLTKTALGAGSLRNSLLGNIAGLTRSVQLPTVQSSYSFNAPPLPSIDSLVAQYGAIPQLAMGGLLTRGGLVRAHKDELVVPIQRIRETFREKIEKVYSTVKQVIGTTTSSESVSVPAMPAAPQAAPASPITALVSAVRNIASAIASGLSGRQKQPSASDAIPVAKAADLPSLATGGMLTQTGLVLAHQNEVVAPIKEIREQIKEKIHTVTSNVSKTIQAQAMPPASIASAGVDLSPFRGMMDQLHSIADMIRRAAPSSSPFQAADSLPIAKADKLPSLAVGGLLKEGGVFLAHPDEIIMPMNKLSEYINKRAQDLSSFSMPQMQPALATAGVGGDTISNQYSLAVHVETNEDLEDPDVFDRKIARPFVKLISRGNRGHRAKLVKAFKEQTTTRR